MHNSLAMDACQYQQTTHRHSFTEQANSVQTLVSSIGADILFLQPTGYFTEPVNKLQTLMSSTAADILFFQPTGYFTEPLN
jgi:hypothetical protein